MFTAQTVEPPALSRFYESIEQSEPPPPTPRFFSMFILLQQFSSKLQNFSKYPHCLSFLLKRRCFKCFRVAVLPPASIWTGESVRELNVFKYESSYRIQLECFKFCSLLETCCSYVVCKKCIYFFYFSIFVVNFRGQAQTPTPPPPPRGPVLLAQPQAPHPWK
jgi:hypothetical protein